MRRRGLLLLAVVSLLRTAPTFAHHPVDAYLMDQTQSVEGALVQLRFQNPHATLLIETRGDNEQPQRWAVEWTSALRLQQQGIAPETLKFGDHVIVTGNPGHNPADHRLRARTIVRPKDGWKWAGGFE